MRRATQGEKLARFLELRDANDWRDAEESLKIADDLVKSFRSIVRYVLGLRRASTIPPSLRAVIDREDLEAVGHEALVKALWTFDPDGVGEFSGYAIGKIRWAMVHEVRDRHMLSTTAKTVTTRSRRAAEELSKRLGRDATEEEAARAAGIAVAVYRKHRAWEERSAVGAITEPVERYLSCAEGDPLERLCAIEEALEELGEDAEIAEAAEEVREAVESVKAIFGYGTRAA